MGETTTAALEVYAAHGAALIEAYEAVDPHAVFAPLAALLPAPGRMLDIGAGTGRDALWFAQRGFSVTAVEPTASLRAFGQDRCEGRVDWVDDSLPHLHALGAGQFDCALLNAIWHHLEPAARDTALVRLATLIRPGGRVLLALRQGPELAGQPVEPMHPEAEIARAHAAGFRLVGRVDPVTGANAGLRAGAEWVWIAFDHEKGEPS